ncbi:permease [candidate division KSB1 bacterium]|nr:permease [candidate division KSB1 bacterium]
MFILLYQILQESVDLWLAISPYLLLGMFIAGVLHAFLGENFVGRHLGDGGFKSILKATLFGIPLPLCSCGVIPVAASLKKEGASKSAVLSFLVSTPTTGVDSILATYSLMGPLFAIFRPLAAFVSGITIGVFNRLYNREEEKKANTHSHSPLPSPFKLKEVFRYGFVELAEEIGKWLLVGVVAGGILTVAIPEGLLTRYLPYPALQFFIMLALAIPLYVCATGSIPIAAALIGKGFSPGAALVFLIAGPATNTVTLSFVYSKLGRRAFYIYLSIIILVSLLMGWIFNLLWRGLGGDVGLISPHGQVLSPGFTIAAGIVLLLLIIRGFFPTRKGSQGMKYQLQVSDMTCKHCKMTIENGLRKLPGVDQVVVDLEHKTVGVDGEVSLEDIKKAIREVGYTPEGE